MKNRNEREFTELHKYDWAKLRRKAETSRAGYATMYKIVDGRRTILLAEKGGDRIVEFQEGRYYNIEDAKLIHK